MRVTIQMCGQMFWDVGSHIWNAQSHVWNMRPLVLKCGHMCKSQNIYKIFGWMAKHTVTC